MSKPLRKCIKCGKEAWTLEELNEFRPDSRSKHGKINKCIRCIPKPILPYLRKCRVCGIEAKTEEELELFPRQKSNLYGRMIICKKCYNEEHCPKPTYLRKCRVCGLEINNEDDLKLFVKFDRNKHGYQNYCKKCANKYNMNIRHEKKFKYMTDIKRFECKKRGLPFDLDHEYLESLWEQQGGLCAISGIEMTPPNSSSAFEIAASLDRIECDKGYIKGNVRWILNCINMLKQKRDDAFIYYIVEAIVKNKPNNLHHKG